MILTKFQTPFLFSLDIFRPTFYAPLKRVCLRKPILCKRLKLKFIVAI
jgi:hypothetical protein